jgi:glutaredoxin
MASLLKVLPDVEDFHRYELDTDFTKQQFQMEFGSNATYPQISIGNKHVGSMHDTLNYMKNIHMLDK